jgi:Flp pilus assembly protein protease CpaA
MPALDPALLVAACLSLVACATDLKARRVPNVLTFGGMALGILLNGMSRGGWLDAAFGLVLAFALTFPAWALGGLRAGDAKLLMALGAILGWKTSLYLVFLSYLLAIPTMLVAMAVTGRMRLLPKVLAARLRRDPTGPKPASLPFAPVIAAALAVAIVWPVTRFLP